METLSAWRVVVMVLASFVLVGTGWVVRRILRRIIDRIIARRERQHLIYVSRSWDQDGYGFIRDKLGEYLPDDFNQGNPF